MYTAVDLLLNLAYRWSDENVALESDRGKNLILVVALVDDHPKRHSWRERQLAGTALRSGPLSRASALQTVVAEL